MYSELKNRAISNISTINTYNKQLVDISSNLDILFSTNKDTKKKIELLTKSLDVMKLCISKLSETHINHLNDLVNSMLKQVFDDRDYEIDFRLSDTKNGKNLNIYLKDSTESDEPVVTEIHDNGGGIQTVVGFILQVYFIIYFKQEPILFLDEQLSALSKEYIPNLCQFMNKLTEEYGFYFVAVVHDERFKEMATSLYTIQQGRLIESSK